MERAAQPADVQAQPHQQAATETTLDEQPGEQSESPIESPARLPDGPPEPPFDVGVANRYLAHLAGTLGPRASGTDQERAAAEYLSDTFTSIGYHVEVQEFEFSGRQSIGRIDTADGYSSFAFRFPGSSGDAAVGRLVAVPGFGEVSDFESVDVTGAIALVDRGVLEFRVKAANAEAAGAVALIITNRQMTESLGGTFGAYQSSIPVLHVDRNAGIELRERLELEVAIPEASPDQGTSQNVIARLPESKCRIVVGGHYDTVPEVDGANDNASGTALTLALAEIWFSHPGGVDICFVGFGAEELGLHGSNHFVSSMQTSGEIDQVTAMLNLDAIGDGSAPYQIIASTALRELGRSVADDLQINVTGGFLPTNLGSDHASFADAGIPVVFVFPPGAILHTPLDNLERVDYELFEDISRLNHGILACLLARAGSSIAPSVSCGSEQR